MITRIKSMSFLLEDEDTLGIFESKTFRSWAADHRIFPRGFKFGLNEKEGYKETILLIDSVIVFTLALLSKICCICTKIKRPSDLKSHQVHQGCHIFPLEKKGMFESLLSLNENYPQCLSVRKAFEGYDRVTVDFAFVVTFYTFATTFGNGISVKEHLRSVNEDDDVDAMFDMIHRVHHMLIEDTHNDAALFMLGVELQSHPYVSFLYENSAHVALIEKKLVYAELCSRFALILDPECCHAFFMLTSSLLAQKEIHKAHLTAAFASKHCMFWTCKHCNTLKKVAEEFKNRCDKCSPEQKHSILTNAKEKAASSKSTATDSDHQEIFDAYGLHGEAICESFNITNETPNGRLQNIAKVESEIDQLIMETLANDQCRDQKNLTSTRPKVRKKDKDNFLKKQEVTLELIVEKALLEGRCAIKTGCMDKAKSHFNEVLDIVKKFPKVSEALKIDVPAIKFVYGYSCFKCFTLENMNQAIAIFKEIIDSGAKHVAAVHYFLGLAFSKFQKFETALTYFKTASSMVKEEFNLNVFALLDENSSMEFDYENIQISLKEEISKCEFPPLPDATCRYDTCNFDTSIYFSDLSFKKCISLVCEERCILQYHFTCWKLLKESSAKTEKDFLDTPCLTPDCSGLITKIEIIRKNGEIEKQFVSKEDSRPKKHGKSKKIDMEDKTEQKEHERKRSRSRTISKNFEDESELVAARTHSKESIKSQVHADQSGHKNDANEKASVENEVLRCKSFPHPDAFCRYESCNQNREIYFSHLSSEVFICVHCEKQCAIQYHVPCWKSQKKALCKIDDDEFLDSACFTPDCDSVITKIDVFGRDGVCERHFTSKDNYKPKTKKRVKQRKLKLEKKQEQKERKKLEVLSQIMSGNFEALSDEAEPTIENSRFTESHVELMNEMPIRNTYHHKVNNNEYDLAIGGNAKPSTSNSPKKESNSISPKKEQKRPKIFSSPQKDLDDWSKPYTTKSPVTSLSEFIDLEASAKIDISSKTDGLSGTFTYEDELKTVIISHFYDFLESHGFISLDDPQLGKEIRKLPKDAIDLIEKEDVMDLCKFDDSIRETSPNKVQVDVHIGAGSTNLRTQATANQDNSLDNNVCQSKYNSKDVNGAVEVNASNGYATHKFVNDVPSGARSQTVSMSSYTEEYESSSESDLEDLCSKTIYSLRVYPTRKSFELKENSLPSNAAGKKHNLDSDDGVNMKSETVSKILESNVGDDLNAICEKSIDKYETEHPLSEPKNFMNEMCQPSQFVPSQEKSADFEVIATDQVEAFIKIEKTKESASKQEIQIPIQNHDIDKEIASHVEIKNLRMKDTVTDKHGKQMENVIIEESVGELVSLEGNEEIQNAELKILDKKKVEYLKVFEATLLNAETNVQDLKSGLAQMEYMYRFVQSTMTQMQNRFNEYIIDLYDLRNTFNNGVTAQMEKIKGGALLSQLEKLEIPTFPPLPTIDSVLCEMNLDRTSSDITGATTNAEGHNQLSPKATNPNPQGYSQYPSEFMQSCYSHMFKQNLFAKDSGAYLVNDNQACKVPSSLQTASVAASVQEQPLVSESSSKSVPVNDFFSNDAATVSHQNRPQAPKSVGDIASCEIITKLPSLRIENTQPESTSSSKISQGDAKSIVQPNKTGQPKCLTSEISRRDDESFSQPRTPLLETKHQSCSVISEISQSNIKPLVQIVKPLDQNDQPNIGASSELQNSIEFVSQAINQLHKNVQSKSKTSSKTDAESLPQEIKSLPENMQLKEKPLPKPSKDVKPLSEVLKHLSNIKKLKSKASSEISQTSSKILSQPIQPLHESIQSKREASSEITQTSSKTVSQPIKPLHESTQPKSEASLEITQTSSKTLSQPIKPLHESMQPKSKASSEITQTSSKTLSQPIKPLHESTQSKSEASSEIIQTFSKTLPQPIKPLHESMQSKSEASSEITQTASKTLSQPIKPLHESTQPRNEASSEITQTSSKTLSQSIKPLHESTQPKCEASSEIVKSLPPKSEKLVHKNIQPKNNAFTEISQTSTKSLPPEVLKLVHKNIQPKNSASTEISQTSTKSLPQTTKPLQKNMQPKNNPSTEKIQSDAKSLLRASRESISSGSFYDCEDSASIKSSLIFSNSVGKGMSATEFVNEKSAKKSNPINDAAVSTSIAKAERIRAMCKKVINTLKQEFPTVKDSEIMSYIKQYRTEKGGKLPNVPLAAIVTDVKEIMMRTKKHKVANVGTTKQVENALLSHEGAASAADTKIKTVVSEPKNFNAATSEYLNAPTCSAPSSLGSSSSDRMAHPKGKTLNELYTKKQAEATTVTNVEEIMMSTKKKMVANVGTTKQVGNHVLSHQGVASAADTKIKTVVSEPKNFNAATSECISAPTCSAPSGLGSSSSDRMAHPKGKTLNELYTKNQAEATTVTDVKEIVMGTKKKKVTNVRTTKQVENPVFSHQVAASAADTKIKTVVSEPKNFNPATFECLKLKGKTLKELYIKNQAEDTAKIQSNLTHFVTDAKKTSTGNNRAQRDTRNETLINSASTKSALKRCDNGPRKGSSRSASKDMKTDPQIILTYPKSSQPKKLSNKTLTSCSKPKQPPKAEQKKQSICPWAKVLNPDNKSNGDFVSSEQYCCICFELMTVLNTRTTDCGHKFHFKCIKEWCDKQSDCPICRAHLLLSEDFPVLS